MATKSDSPDRRLSPRYFSDCAALVGEQRHRTLRAKAWTLDIGPSGCRLLSDESLRPGADLRMVLVVKGKLMMIQGHVVHERCLGDAEFEVGVCFGKIRPHAREILSSLGSSPTANPA
jgi:hypothetical protein